MIYISKYFLDIVSVDTTFFKKQNAHITSQDFLAED